ncbi:MAG: hypothetical protein J0H82_01125 [Alphaproteobacteria bacterium]|jgi:hypothetical protein|nr:hypothetical protein [Alphaproteobacteria bacterium]
MRLAIAIAALMLAATTVAAAAGGFLSVADDVPLMPGLTEKPGAVVFDKPDGRIVEVDAAGPVQRRRVEEFYEAALPQLGWARDREGAFARENERLSLGFTGRDGQLVVHIAIAPR